MIFLSYLLNPAAFYKKILVIFTVFFNFTYVVNLKAIILITFVKSKADTILHLFHPIFKIHKSVKEKFGRFFLISFYRC